MVLEHFQPKPKEEPKEHDLVRFAEAMFNVNSTRDLDKRALEAQRAQHAIVLVAHYLQKKPDEEVAMLADTSAEAVSELVAAAEEEYAESQDFRDRVGTVCEELGLFAKNLPTREKPKED